MKLLDLALDFLPSYNEGFVGCPIGSSLETQKDEFVYLLLFCKTGYIFPIFSHFYEVGIVRSV